MPSPSPTERAKPLLGTTVRVRVAGLDNARSRAAIGVAFAEIAAIQALMSFHDAQSDVSRLNREAHLCAVRVDARTYEVLVHACTIGAMTSGAFDISVAPELVSRGLLPRPANTAVPVGDWRDIEFLSQYRIRFRKPLWIDLGGIAKGYAVDRAIDYLRDFSPLQACVNAGGDLRIIGDQTEQVWLASDFIVSDDLPVMEIRDGSLASSCGVVSGRRCANESGPHIDTRAGRAALPMQFVSVAAPRCIDADALTKVVMARGACCAKILAQFGAQAVVHDAQFGWREIRGHA